MCDRVTILTKWAVTILVMAVLVVTGFVAILRVAILEWNHFQDSGFRIQDMFIQYNHISNLFTYRAHRLS